VDATGDTVTLRCNSSGAALIVEWHDGAAFVTHFECARNAGRASGLEHGARTRRTVAIGECSA
jgi:hypothetical protein